jgi:hypothetical protein
MRIVGEWLKCDDGVVRPAVHARVAGVNGAFFADDFLIDTGADRTVLSAALLAKLGPATTQPAAETVLQGISGNSPFVLLKSVIVLMCDEGGFAHLRGEFAAFTEPSSTELSILGRDILNHFDIILSRRNNEILLLAPKHQYRVVGE